MLIQCKIYKKTHVLKYTTNLEIASCLSAIEEHFILISRVVEFTFHI